MKQKNKEEEQKTIKEVEKILKYTFKDKELLSEALTHSSYANSFGIKSNERLEFLGDTVLNLVITERIFYDKDYKEGDLSKLRSKIVSQKPLSNVVDNLGLSKYLKTSGLGKQLPTESMKADLLEAVVGAMYADGSLKELKNFILTNFKDVIHNTEELKQLADSKSYLQEMLKNKKIKYISTKSGSDHNPTFKTKLVVDDVVLGTGISGIKKQAEQMAAKEAILKLNQKVKN